MIQAAHSPIDQSSPEGPAEDGGAPERSSPSPGPAPRPAHTPIPTAAILDPTLPAPALQALARLYAAAAPHDFRHTDPLDFDSQLIPLLRLSRTQTHNVLSLLRLARLIQWSSDGARRYTFFLLSPENRISGNSDSAGVVHPDLNFKYSDTQQQHTESGNPDSPAELTVMGALLRAGVWTDHALRIDALLAQNRQRSYNRLPDLRDVLGWIAYCFAYQRKNKIQNPAAVLSACLNANRRCPDELRPPFICATCHCDEEHCSCEEPARHLPLEFLEFAFSNRYDPHRQTFWSVCRRCHAYPCQCAPSEEEEDGEEEEEEWEIRGDTRGW